MAKLVPYTPERQPRKGGLLSDAIWESKDCWDPDPELEKSLYESALEPTKNSTPVAAEDPAPYKA